LVRAEFEATPYYMGRKSRHRSVIVHLPENRTYTFRQIKKHKMINKFLKIKEAKEFCGSPYYFAERLGVDSEGDKYALIKEYKPPINNRLCLYLI